VVVGAAFAAGDALPVPVEGVVLGVVAACAGAGWWVLSEPAREQAITAGLSAEELGAGVQGLLENGYEDAPEGAPLTTPPPVGRCWGHLQLGCLQTSAAEL
jgi:hypothetical protein